MICDLGQQMHYDCKTYISSKPRRDQRTEKSPLDDRYNAENCHSDQAGQQYPRSEVHPRRDVKGGVAAAFKVSLKSHGKRQLNKNVQLLLMC